MSAVRNRLVLPGFAAAAVAAGAVTAVAAVAKAAGVTFEPPGGGGAIPLLGFAQVTFTFSVLGLGIALAVRRWASRPARLWVRVAVALTGLSLIPPVLVGVDAVTAGTLVLTHLVAAVVVIPVIAGRLPADRAGGRSASRSEVGPVGEPAVPSLGTAGGDGRSVGG